MTKNIQHGLGRRKTAIARVFLTDDKAQRMVNGLTLDAYFPSPSMQKIATQPLEVTSQASEYGLKVKVTGGGKQSQAEAVSLGIARALLEADEGFRKQLKTAGLLRRDSRTKERKKPGLKGARRAPQFSKR